MTEGEGDGGRVMVSERVAVPVVLVIRPAAKSSAQAAVGSEDSPVGSQSQHHLPIHAFVPDARADFWPVC